MTECPAPNTNTSATGGYLISPAISPLPSDMCLDDFLQSVIVGISNLPGELVRNKWQINPPKQPDVCVDWISIGLAENDSDTFAYDSLNATSGVNIFQRMEALALQCSFYGPHSMEVAQNVRDGFQILQNLEALKSVGMNFVSTDKMVRAPDLVNERWVNRWEMTVHLRREILRVYPILTFLSASGTLYALGSNGVKTIPIVAGER